jgi:hypothetical protein
MQKVIFVILTLVLSTSILIGQQAPPAAPPPVPAEMTALANKVADAINKQDAAALTAMVTSDAVYLDEDGHAVGVPRWIQRLTTGTPAKKITISQMRGQTWENSGWVSFNYVLSENFREAPYNLKGTASIVARKAPGSANWQIALIHGALEQKVAGVTQ